LNASTWDSFKAQYDLRKGLATYIYSAFEAQGQTSLSLARALVMDLPDDIATWYVDDQFLIGQDLMFAPAGMDKPKSTSTVHSVYFPKTATSWHNWFENSTSYKPGLMHAVPTPILQAPLFVKGGSVLPFQHPDAEEHTLELVAFAPAACGDGVMCWSSAYDGKRLRRGDDHL
jgi:alpha-glucosidase (family GH31 glycosyl hydrolase)